MVYALSDNGGRKITLCVHVNLIKVFCRVPFREGKKNNSAMYYVRLEGHPSLGTHMQRNLKNPFCVVYYTDSTETNINGKVEDVFSL